MPDNPDQPDPFADAVSRDNAAWAARSAIKAPDLPRFQYPEETDRSRITPRVGPSQASGAPVPQFLALIDVSTHNPTTGDIIAAQIRVTIGNVNSAPPDGFNPGDSPPFILIVTGTSPGVVFLKVTYDPTTGIISDVSVNFASTLPSDTSGTQYYTLGSYTIGTKSIMLSNSACGPVTTVPCQTYFTDTETWTLSFYANGPA